MSTDYVEKSSYAATGTGETRLGKKAAEIIGSNTDKSVMYLINEGNDAFYARMTLIAQAQNSIDVQYFICYG